jgi:hypothetical protein
MPAIAAVPLIAAAVSGGASVAGSAIAAHGSNKAAQSSIAAANHAADVEAQSQAEALAFQRQQAENTYRNTEVNRRGNYDQWAARESRLGSIGQLLGYGARPVPAYVPSVDPQFAQQPQQPQQTRRPVVGSVGSYLT